MAWIAAAPAPFTRAVAAEHYDLDRLTTWLVTVLFNGTGDLYQEAMLREIERFLERTIGTAQLLLAKPAAMPAPLLGRFDA